MTTGQKDAINKGRTIEQFVEDLEQLRLVLGGGKINLIGGSWGSMVAKRYAMKYSDRIQAMVLMPSIGIRPECFPFYQANIEKQDAGGQTCPGKNSEVRGISAPGSG